MSKRKLRKRIVGRMKREFEVLRRRLNKDWSDWDLETVSDRYQDRWIRAESFTPPKLFDTEPYFPDGAAKYERSPLGNWAYSNRVSEPLDPGFNDETGTCFSGRVVIPCLTDLWMDSDFKRFANDVPEAKRFRDGRVWMCITPAEMLTQRSGIRIAKGKVLIGGLGLGWFLEQVCKKDEVEEVVLVERSQELLDWFGYRLCRAQPKVKGVICDDVYAVVDRFPDHQLLLDIWPVFRGMNGADHDQRLADLRRRAPGRVWAWGMD